MKLKGKKVMNRALLVLLFIAAASGFMVKTANANILITPTRVVFEDRDRFALVTLVNTSGKTRTYNIEWTFFKMLDGQSTYEAVDAPSSDFDLSKYIVFSPRRITLAPGASQKIRLALRRPEHVPDGDYHAHLKFYLDPDAPEEIIERQKEIIAKGKNRAGAAITINVSYSIPVFLIVGQPDAQAKIGDLSMERNQQSGGLQAKFTVHRTGGPYSVMGHIYIYHKGASGDEELVGEISNAHIFAEASSRNFDIPLTKEISGGALRIVVKHYNPGNSFVYDERTFPLQ